MTAVECNSKQKRVHSEFLLSPKNTAAVRRRCRIEVLSVYLKQFSVINFTSSSFGMLPLFTA